MKYLVMERIYWRHRPSEVKDAFLLDPDGESFPIDIGLATLMLNICKVRKPDDCDCTLAPPYHDHWIEPV